MKTIGLLGGMSWESTAAYYRIVNEEVQRRRGGLHSARCVVYSLDFAEVEECQRTGDWLRAEQILAEGARRLVAAGAELLLICSNTMHKLAEQIESDLPVPLLHIADATAQEALRRRIHCVGLLGTRFTMEEDFYRARLERHGLRVLVPPAPEREWVDGMIFGELVRGRFSRSSRQELLAVVAHLADRGAQGVILGCTELGLLVQQRHTTVPLLDTTELHARAAVERALRD
ncbi:MAG: aspartate/glutamate racemase family protein [candidate division KSB1 bacterium]|nr:aspartate/glutamate racemase family protein [candidate division KSB1 bacterium]